MTITAWFLLAGLALAGVLVLLAVVIQRPGEALPPRPLPYPKIQAHPRSVPPPRLSRHSAEDRDSETVRINPEPYRGRAAKPE